MRVMLMLLLLVAATPAAAGLVKMVVTENDDVVYIDPATIRKFGNLRRVRVIQDLSKKGPGGEMSRRVFWEYDCVEARYRGLAATSYAGPLASGQVLKSVEIPGDWVDVAPETVDALILKTVCAP